MLPDGRECRSAIASVLALSVFCGSAAVFSFEPEHLEASRT